MKNYPIAASGGFAAANGTVAPSPGIGHNNPPLEGFTPCADVRARIVENVRKEGKEAFRPTTMAIRMVEAVVRSA